MTPADGRLRVVIAEDAVLLREGLRRVLTDAGLEVAGVAGDAAQLLQLVAVQRPAVVLADIRMPPTQTTEGLEAAVEIRRREQAQLGEHVPDVGLHRLGRHEQLSCDRLVGPALGHQGQDGQLTFGQRLQRAVLPGPGHTYTAIDPPRSAGATLTLDGFFGWPLATVAS